jgi:hypothetical protein
MDSQKYLQLYQQQVQELREVQGKWAQSYERLQVQKAQIDRDNLLAAQLNRDLNGRPRREDAYANTAHSISYQAARDAQAVAYINSSGLPSSRQEISDVRGCAPHNLRNGTGR